MPSPRVVPHHPADLEAWQVLRPLLDAGPYLPWSSGALRPAALVRACNEVVLGDRRAVVECGSGMSTVVLARLLRQREAGQLVALEHDEGWAQRVHDLLRREALQDRARVVHAPLDGDPPWYAEAALDDLPMAIDLLLVDGPPAYLPGDEHRRAPALTTLDDRLAHGATVVLDDIDRPGERAVLEGWETATAWRFARDEVAAVAVGARDRAPTLL
ncbi:class I SAM-dependent methyltransferase [Conexibacter sp. SYSU D00693]|uniref:class I SAM-dependent methyltransferase n=1 Tax=Conexibacter sp. SYSU D00693 TaxID=2812560 RepID=UPI00196B2AF4|nr:class I SAM-dependent methyltransferase [Conexibacter sp. SYSU D00693]